jgi:hypothetical protein
MRVFALTIRENFMKPFIRSVLIGMAACLLLAGTAVAQETRTPPIGGNGGGPYRLDCGQDGAIVGINARVDNFLNGVEVVCRKVRDNQLVGDTYVVGNTGGDYGRRVQQLCPVGSLVTGLSGSWNARSYNIPGVQVFAGANYVHEIALRCQRWNDRANRFETAGTIGAGGSRPGSERRGPNDAAGWCPANAVGSALEGRSGIYIDSIALVCDQTRIRPPRFESLKCPPNVRATADVVGNDGPWKATDGQALRFWRVWVENDTMICGYVTTHDRGDKNPDHWRIVRDLPNNGRCRVDDGRPGEVICRGDRR